MKTHSEFMFKAIELAREAALVGEVPIGAIIVKGGEVIAGTHNLREVCHDATAHAEILAIRQAGQALGTWRLSGCTLYVTIEPCPMCAGALLQSRIDRLVYGADDPKAWADRSLLEIVQNPKLNHRIEVTAGVLADECADLVRSFFQKRRRLPGG